MKIIKKILIWVNLLFYIVFSYIYFSDGLKIQLATKSSEFHKVYENNKFYYDNYYYKPVSPFLCKIGLVGMIVTGILFLITATYKTYKKIETNRKVKLKSIRSIVIIGGLYIVLLEIINAYVYVNFGMLVGEWYNWVHRVHK